MREGSGRMKVEVFKDQRYAKLRKHHQELGVPWTDHTFPANDSSIGIQKVNNYQFVRG